MDNVKEIKIYLNCKKMLNKHARIVYKSKYCKKGEYKRFTDHLVVRFYMDFNQDGNLEIFEKIVYQPDVATKIDYKSYLNDYAETPYQHFQRLDMYRKK